MRGAGPRAISQCQKGSGLVCGLSTRKVRTPCSIQKQHDAQDLVPQRSPGRRSRSSSGKMSWYFLGGFSAYLMVPSGRWLEPLRVLPHLRVVRRALEGEVERDLDAVERAAAATKRRKSSSVPSSGCDRVVAALGAADGPRAAGVAGRRRRARCSGPCGWSGRWGGSAAGRRRRSPCAGCRGAASTQSSNVPWRPGSRPCERGNSSYQAAKRAARGRRSPRARGRTGACASRRSWQRAISPPSAGSRSEACRAALAARRRPTEHAPAAASGPAVARRRRATQRAGLQERARPARSGRPADAPLDVAAPTSRRGRSTPRRCSVARVRLERERARPAVVVEGAAASRASRPRLVR